MLLARSSLKCNTNDNNQAWARIIALEVYSLRNHTQKLNPKANNIVKPSKIQVNVAKQLGFGR